MVSVTLVSVICLVPQGERLRTALSPVRVGCGPATHTATIHITNKGASSTLSHTEETASSKLPFQKRQTKRDCCLLTLARFCSFVVCLGKEQSTGYSCDNLFITMTITSLVISQVTHDQPRCELCQLHLSGNNNAIYLQCFKITKHFHICWLWQVQLEDAERQVSPLHLHVKK